VRRKCGAASLGEMVDLYDKLMEVVGWKVVDKEKEVELILV
jgi:hypothetical protein